MGARWGYGGARGGGYEGAPVSTKPFWTKTGFDVKPVSTKPVWKQNRFQPNRFGAKPVWNETGLKPFETKPFET